jgi:hypothetical protein
MDKDIVRKYLQICKKYNYEQIMNNQVEFPDELDTITYIKNIGKTEDIFNKYHQMKTGGSGGSKGAKSKTKAKKKSKKNEGDDDNSYQTQSPKQSHHQTQSPKQSHHQTQSPKQSHHNNQAKKQKHKEHDYNEGDTYVHRQHPHPSHNSSNLVTDGLEVAGLAVAGTELYNLAKSPNATQKIKSSVVNYGKEQLNSIKLEILNEIETQLTHPQSKLSILLENRVNEILKKLNS